MPIQQRSHRPYRDLSEWGVSPQHDPKGCDWSQRAGGVRFPCGPRTKLAAAGGKALLQRPNLLVRRQARRRGPDRPYRGLSKGGAHAWVGHWQAQRAVNPSLRTLAVQLRPYARVREAGPRTYCVSNVMTRWPSGKATGCKPVYVSSNLTLVSGSTSMVSEEISGQRIYAQWILVKHS